MNMSEPKKRRRRRVHAYRSKTSRAFRQWWKRDRFIIERKMLTVKEVLERYGKPKHEPAFKMIPRPGCGSSVIVCNVNEMESEK